MKVFVLAGGEGTRLRPYTYSAPKPMLVLGGKPILEYVLENLRRCGVKDATVTAGYMHEQITSHFGDGSKLGMKLDYAIEKERMNTAGSVLPLKGQVKGTFAVVMGDHLTDLDIADMAKQHKKSGAIATVALFRKKHPIEYGVATVDGGAVTGFAEKPMLDHLYNTAIYVFEPEIFDYIKEREDFAKDVIPRLLSKGKKINAYVFEGVWFDIGRVSDYERFAELFDIMRFFRRLES